MRTAEMDYINKHSQPQLSHAQIICKACECNMSSGISAWTNGYCPLCYPVVNALTDLYVSDHRKHYNAIQTMAKREASWLQKM